MIRIEATYLLKELPKGLEKVKKSEIEQGYISSASDPIRVRKKDNSYSITRKIKAIPTDQSLREHLDIPIEKGDYEALKKIFVRSLEKTRYYFDQTMDYEIRIDRFRGDLEGISLIEVIFSDESYKNDFAPPAWFGEEVTKEDWASNSYFAGKKAGEINKKLEQFLKGKEA